MVSPADASPRLAGKSVTEFRGEVQVMGESLAETLRSLLASLPDPTWRPQTLSRRLGQSVATTFRLLKAVESADPLDVLLLVPGPGPLRRVIQAAKENGADPNTSAAAMSAADRFGRFIRDHAGDRGTLNSILSAWSPASRREFDLRRRQTMFKARSELQGAYSGVDVLANIVAPSADGSSADLVVVQSLIGLVRHRPGAPVRLTTKSLADRTAEPSVNLDGEPFRGDLAGVRVDRFCSRPPVRIDSRSVGDQVDYLLIDKGFGRGVSTDLVFAEVSLSAIFGSAPGQITPGSRIDPAILTLTTEGPGAESLTGAQLHRMLVPWDESHTWSSFGDGVTIGIDAEATPDLVTGNAAYAKRTSSFDVTTSIQAWSDGTSNRGWVFDPGGTDRWSFRSSDWVGIVERPMLTVRLAQCCPPPTTYCESSFNSVGTKTRIGYGGTPLISSNDLVLNVEGSIPDDFGLFFYGLRPTQMPWGDGTRCVSGGGLGIFRLSPAMATDGAGAVQRALDLNAPPTSGGPGAIDAGSTWHFQWWYRDPQSGGDFNLSDGLRVTFCP